MGREKEGERKAVVPSPHLHRSMTTLSNLFMAENRLCDWSNRRARARAMRRALKDRCARPSPHH